MAIETANKYSFFKELKEAIAGSEMDFSTGPLRKAIVLLSIPMVLEVLMESVFVVVDIFYVSHLGSDAVAAVGLTESIMTIVMALGLGLATGATAIISRRFGEKKYRLASISAVQAIIAAIAISFFIAIPAILYSKELLKLMGASDKVVAIGWEYTKWMLGGNVVLILLFVNNAIFRSAGDAAVAMRVLWLANLLNIIIAPILIFWLGMGVKGAAIATVCGRGTGVLYQFWLLLNGRNRIKVTIKEMILYPKIIWRLLGLSIGATAQNLIVTTSWVFLMRIVASFGSSVVAGYTISIRVIIFVILPAWGLSNAASTLVGQSLGAGNPKRAERAVWVIGGVNAALMLLISVVLVVFPSFFIKIFISDPEVIAYGAESLRIICYGMVFYSLGMVMLQALNGAGDTYTPVLINILCFWVLEIPLAYILSRSSMHENGVFWSVVIAESILAILAMLVFAWGKWKVKKV